MHEVSTSLGFAVSGRSLILGIFAFFASILKIFFFSIIFSNSSFLMVGFSSLWAGGPIYFLTDLLQILNLASSFAARSSNQQWKGLGRCGF